jgi:SAM-dependent methyltransferase
MEPLEELRRFEALYDVSFDENRASRREAWDRRAENWDRKYREEGERQLHEVRVKDMASWLRERGVLGPELDVADIGCGPGRFAAEFARTARSVLGVDISPRMTEFGAEYCREQGLGNVRFQAADFPNADIRALGWEKRFDLVFSSITPAVSGLRGLENFMAMSRAWCFNASFVYNVNELQGDVMRALFDREPRRYMTSHSHWFYELFSLLWFRGYYPECSYYKQYREIRIPADESTAARYAEFLLEPEEATQENKLRILRYLEGRADADGSVTEISDCWYGWLLWDVRDRHDR